MGDAKPNDSMAEAVRRVLLADFSNEELRSSGLDIVLDSEPSQSQAYDRHYLIINNRPTIIAYAINGDDLPSEVRVDPAGRVRALKGVETCLDHIASLKKDISDIDDTVSLSSRFDLFYDGRFEGGLVLPVALAIVSQHSAQADAVLQSMNYQNGIYAPTGTSIIPPPSSALVN